MGIRVFFIMINEEPKYFSYNIDFAKRRGIIASVLMGRLIYEMKLNLPNNEFVFDLANACRIYTDEIQNEMEYLKKCHLIAYEILNNNKYIVSITKYGIFEYVYNCFDYIIENE